MNKRMLAVLWVLPALQLLPGSVSAQQPFTLEQIMRAPFAENLTAARKVNRVAWTLNQEGKRNVWVADGPTFQARRMTSYLEDDGQEI